MSEIIIYGASDDLIEVEGDINQEVSVYVGDHEPLYVAISDGSLLRVTYDGMWTIRVLRKGFGTMIDHHQATDEDSDYSDRVTLTSELNFLFVVVGEVGMREDRSGFGGLNI